METQKPRNLGKYLYILGGSGQAKHVRDQLAKTYCESKYYPRNGTLNGLRECFGLGRDLNQYNPKTPPSISDDERYWLRSGSATKMKFYFLYSAFRVSFCNLGSWFLVLFSANLWEKM